MSSPAPGGDRVITGAQMRAARAWADEQRPHLLQFDCSGRVLAVVGQLISNTDGWYATDDLHAALHDVDTVDVALELLDAAGLGCV